ncbi:MAG: DUF5615 family PIN-like protein [Planctomycetaceae bacterium]
MLQLLADENLNRLIVKGVVDRLHTADFPRTQDLDLGGMPDPELLEWAAQANRVVVSHDVSTMTKHATDRLRQGHSFPGLLLIPSTTTTAVAIDELVMLCQCSDQLEWENLIAFLPL